MAKKKSRLRIIQDHTREWKKITKKDLLHPIKFPDEMEDQFGLTRKQRESLSTLESCFLRAAQQCKENVSIDTECAEFAFAGHFLYGNAVAREDVYMVLTDFNAKRGGRFEEFLQYVPMLNRANYTCISPDAFMRQELVGLLYGGTKAGDGYCREMLRMLYKTFYKSEYNQVKRFSILHGAEVVELCKRENGKELDVLKASRILCMAHALGMQVDESCRPYYIAIADIVTKIDEDTQAEKHSLQKIVNGEQLRTDLQNLPRTAEIIKQAYRDKDGNLAIFDKANSLISRMFSDQGDFTKDYLSQSFPVHQEHAIEYVNALITDMGLSDKFSNEEIALLAPFVAVISSYSVLTVDYKNLLYSFLYPNSNLEANRSSLLDSLNHLKLADTAPKRAEITTDELPADNAILNTDESHDALENELALLRARLREKESECKELRVQYKKEKNAREKNENELNEIQSEKVELQRLRDYVYHETEEDFPETVISYDEMKSVIKDRDIIIIGGNENWTKKLKNEFPHWKFVRAIVSPTVTNGIIKYCEKAYFFTDTLGHSNYAKFVDLARIHNVDFSYLHDVNLQKNVEQIYRDFAS